MKKSNFLATAFGLVVGISVITAFLLMTVPFELYAADGNPLIEKPNLNAANLLNPKVEAPTLGHSTLVNPGPIVLPPEQKSVMKTRKEGIVMQTVNGFLHHVSAIGGETTGWAIRLGQPLNVPKQGLMNDIEVAADDSLLASLLDRQVEARGRITWRQGIERGRYPVLTLESIHGL
jgi:hypothetical protein